MGSYAWALEVDVLARRVDGCWRTPSARAVLLLVCHDGKRLEAIVVSCSELCKSSVGLNKLLEMAPLPKVNKVPQMRMKLVMSVGSGHKAATAAITVGRGADPCFHVSVNVDPRM